MDNVSDEDPLWSQSSVSKPKLFVRKVLDPQVLCTVCRWTSHVYIINNMHLGEDIKLSEWKGESILSIATTKLIK